MIQVKGLRPLSAKEKKSIGKKLRLYRKAGGYNQMDFSKFIEVPPSTVANWERGTRLSSLVSACRLHRKTKGELPIEITRPDFIKFLREFKDVIDDLKI